MRRRRAAGWMRAGALAVLLAAPPAIAGDGLTQEDREVLAWLDRTDLPKGGGRWVHATTGEFEPPDDFRPAEPAKQPERPEVVRGFLLEETAESIRVLQPNGLERAIRKAKAGEPPREAGSVVVTDARLAEDARQWIAEAVAGTHRPIGGLFESFEENVGSRAELAVVARYAVALGETSLVHDLFVTATSVKAFGDEKQPDRTFLQRLQGDLSTPLFGRVIVAFGDPRVPRATLAERTRRFVDAFPSSEHTERAKSTLAVLEQMVAEDEAHAKAARSFDTMTRDEQIAELVFLLRDQNGGQFSQPGAPSIWSDPRKKDSPAERLLTYGEAAIPALIPAIEDVRWTRTVGYWRDFSFSHYVLTVGDAVLEVLERIAGRTFWPRTYIGASMAREVEARKVRARVDAWWQDRHLKGEEQQLVLELVGGGRDAPDALARLIEGYPGAVPDAVARAMPNLVDASTRFRVLQRLAEVDDPRIDEILIERARSDPSQECRVRAALLALARGHPEMREVLFREWAVALRSPPTSTFNVSFGFQLLTNFLLWRAGPEGVAALSDALPALPADVAAQVFERAGVVADGDQTAALRDAREDMLARLLVEDATTGAVRSDFNGPIRLNDVAAHELARLLGDVTSFDTQAPEVRRDRQIAAMLAAWRDRRKLPPAPIDPPPPASKPGEVVAVKGTGLAAEAEERWAAMKGKAVDPDAVVASLRGAVDGAPPGRVRVRLLVRRRARDGGVMLFLESRRMLGDAGEAHWRVDIDARSFAPLPRERHAVQPEPPGDDEFARVRDMLRALSTADESDVVVEASFTRQPRER